jgi:hypothetical protein
MFTNETVFITGAGGSWHYGYPTGEQLIKKIIAKARNAAEFFRAVSDAQPEAVLVIPNFLNRTGTAFNLSELTRARGQWKDGAKESEELAARLDQVKPLQIDYFLGQNPDLQDIGKFLIAWIILECESRYLAAGANINRKELLEESPIKKDRDNSVGLDITKYKDAWYRFVLHKLVTGCKKSSDLLLNRVQFVTFNYDVSLEHHLFAGLNHISLFEDEHIREFFSNDRVRHIYGRIRENPFLGFGGTRPVFFTVNKGTFEYPRDQIRYGELKSSLDAVYESSRNLRTIGPTEKIMERATIKSAAQAIQKASCVYILGYGFDETNSEILRLGKSLRLGKGRHKSVMFTNYGESNQVNKRASKLFFRKFGEFLPSNSAIKGTPTSAFYCEKSIRDVYEALEFDFDSLEDQLITDSAI